MYSLFQFLKNTSVYSYAKQKQPGCKKVRGQSEATMAISDQKTLISSKAKKLNILLRILLLERHTIVYRAFSQL